MPITISQTEQTTPRGWLATRWRRFALAVTFLTRLPLPIAGEASQADMRASMGWYPLIGLGLGCVGWGIYRETAGLLTPLVAAVLTIVLLEMCTGALHLDGLMDTCDGIGSGAPRERALEIMKDSRVGAMGVFGALAILLLKVTALSALTDRQSFLPLLVGWMMARAVPVLDVALFRYARATGTGGIFTGGKSPWAPVFALLCVAVAGYFINPTYGVPLAVLVVVITLLVQAAIARKLGGLTGDVYGMGIELAEALALLAGVMITRL